MIAVGKHPLWFLVMKKLSNFTISNFIFYILPTTSDFLQLNLSIRSGIIWPLVPKYSDYGVAVKAEIISY